MKPVSDLLQKQTKELWFTQPETSVFDALQTLAAHEVGALMVLKGGRLVGVISERDYTRKVALQGRNSKETKVEHIMTTQVITVKPTSTTRDCMAMMSQRKIRHLPVLDGDVILGMISIRDLMDDIIAEHEETIQHLTSYISS